MLFRLTFTTFLLAPALFAAACGGDDNGATTDAPALDGPRSDGPGFDAPAPDAPAAWAPPACTMVTGTGAVTFTHDDGATVVPRDQTLTGVKYTFGIVALDTPNALLVAHAGRLLRSDDAGCSWRDLDAVPNILVLVAADGDAAYGYVDNGPEMVRIEGETVTRLPDHSTGVVGLAVDPQQRAHVRMLDADGQSWRSTDAGLTWERIGAPPTSNQIVYRGAYSPTNLDHVIAGTSTEGAWHSLDGGLTWTRARGLGDNANAMNLAFAPSDPTILYATGVAVAPPPGDSPKVVWRSTDGGLNFTQIFDNTGRTIANGMPLFPHPTDPGVLYATFGTYFQGYGTDIYRWDLATGNVTTQHQPFHDVLALAFSPADPSWMYFGITHEQIGGP